MTTTQRQETIAERIAERIANLFSNDGQRLTAAVGAVVEGRSVLVGEPIEAVCARFARRTAERNGAWRYEFRDDSAIVIDGRAWDVEDAAQWQWEESAS